MTSKFLSALMQTLFWQYLSALYGDEIKKFVPSDFVDLCCKGIHVLNKNGKDNILYYLAKGLGTPQADESGPRLPIDRMPFGLLSYNICYFALDAVNKVKADPDYIQWESTMFSNFGHKWVCLQRGPGFAYGALGEDRVSEESSEVEVHGTITQSLMTPLAVSCNKPGKNHLEMMAASHQTLLLTPLMLPTKNH